MDDATTSTITVPPLVFVTEDRVPDMENGDNPPEPDPWCLSCGVRVADGVGFPYHARSHGYAPHNYQLVPFWKLPREEGP